MNDYKSIFSVYILYFFFLGLLDDEETDSG